MNTAARAGKRESRKPLASYAGNSGQTIRGTTNKTRGAPLNKAARISKRMEKNPRGRSSNVSAKTYAARLTKKESEEGTKKGEQNKTEHKTNRALCTPLRAGKRAWKKRGAPQTSVPPDERE